jgi:hypothetical protein
VNQLHWLQIDLLLGQIDAVKLQARYPRITLPDGVQVQGVHIQSDDAPGNAPVDVLESVGTRDSKNRDTGWAAECQGLREQIRQGA